MQLTVAFQYFATRNLFKRFQSLARTIVWCLMGNSHAEENPTEISTIDGGQPVTLDDVGLFAVEAAALLKSLAHPARLLLACALADREYSVGELEGKLAIHQPSLSQQLGVLRGAGIVETRRDAKQIFYRLSGDEASLLIEAVCKIYRKD